MERTRFHAKVVLWRTSLLEKARAQLNLVLVLVLGSKGLYSSNRLLPRPPHPILAIHLQHISVKSQSLLCYITFVIVTKPAILLISSFPNLSSSDIPIIQHNILIFILSSFVSCFHSFLFSDPSINTGHTYVLYI